MGLIFLCYADFKFTQAEKAFSAQSQENSRRRRSVGKLDYQARGVLYLPEHARFSDLMNLPEGSDIGTAIDEAMKAIGQENPELDGVLPRNYSRFDNDLLVSLLKRLNFTQDLDQLEGDVFGKIYEYFLGEFAKSEGQRGNTSRLMMQRSWRSPNPHAYRGLSPPFLRGVRGDLALTEKYWAAGRRILHPNFLS